MSAHNFWNNFSHGFMHGMFNSNPFLGCNSFNFNSGFNFMPFGFCGGCFSIFSNASLFTYPSIMSGSYFPMMQNFSVPSPIFSTQNYGFQNFGLQNFTFPDMTDVFEKTIVKADLSKVNVGINLQPEPEVVVKKNNKKVDIVERENKSVVVNSNQSKSESKKTSSPLQQSSANLLSLTSNSADKYLLFKTAETNKEKSLVAQYPKKQQTKVKNNKNLHSLKTKHWSEMSDAEMKEVYGGYTRDITTQYKGSATHLNSYLKGKGVLENKGQAFIDAQNKYGISASVLVGICMNESAKGKSKLARKQNNVGGVRIVGSNKFRTFSSVEECIDTMAQFLKKGYVDNKGKALTKLYQINAKYCPASDITDKTGENSVWARNVDKYAEEVESVSV